MYRQTLVCIGFVKHDEVRRGLEDELYISTGPQLVDNDR